MDYSTPSFPVLHYLLELTQTHVCWIRDAIQPSHPLSSPSPSVFYLSQHWGLFYWGSSSGSSSLELTGLISLQFKGLSRVFPNTTVQKHQFFNAQPSLWSNSHIHTWLLEKKQTNNNNKKNMALNRWTFVGKAMSLLFNVLCRFVIAFLRRSKHLLISWLQSLSTVILDPKKIKSVTASILICHKVMGPDAMIFNFWMLSFKPAFSLSSFTFIKRLFGCWYFSWLSWCQIVLQDFHDVDCIGFK